MIALRRYAPVVLSSIVLFLVSHQPNIRPPQIGLEWQDKLFHFVAYWCYGATIVWAVRTSPLRRALWTFILGAAFAVSDEWHQSFIPGRSADVADVVADVVGVTVAAFISLGWALRSRSDSRRAHRP